MSITDNFVQVVMSSLTGDVAELVCSVRGKPTPEVHWRKAGELDLALAMADNVGWWMMTNADNARNRLFCDDCNKTGSVALAWPNSN